MPTGCFDYLSDPCVQDMLRRRDETIEILRDEISELDKQKGHRKDKYDDYIKDEKTHFKKGFLAGVISCTILVCLIIIAGRLIGTAGTI